MTPSSFEYFSPASLDDACELLEKYGPDARVLAGGQSLIPLLKLRFTSLKCLVDISRVPELSSIADDGSLHIGAMVRVAELERHPLVSNYHAVADASKVIADPLVRNMGTVGGNLSHGDPSNDLPAVMIAMNASYLLRNRHGSRRVSAREFYLDTFSTALNEGEILSQVDIPRQQGSSYLKHKRSAGDFSVAGVAVALNISGGMCTDCGIGLTSVGPTPLRAAKAEEELRGKRVDDDAIERAAKAAASDAQPSDDFYGSAEYKRFAVRRLAAQAIRIALQRAGGR